MNQKIPLLTLTVTAIGAVAACRFVGFDGAQVDAAGVKAMGVSTFPAINGDDLSLDVIGTTVVEAGGAVAVGDDLSADAEGRAVTAEEGVVLAQALDSSLAAGEFIEVLLVRS